MTLRRMVLRDFVIVQALELDFAPGFTALTGETGAGKSILIDALQLLLGARADAGVVREGAGQAEISAEFTLPPHLHDWLHSQGFAVEECPDHTGGSLLLRRSIDAQGRSRAWVNGSPATATQLRQLGQALVDIHGQHAWQSLMRPESVRQLLDAYAGLSAQAVRQCWQAWRTAAQALEQAQAAQEHLHTERERLLWQIEELQKLNPRADEWEELNQQHARLAHAQTLIDTAQASIACLEGAEDDSAHHHNHHSSATTSLTQGLNRALQLLQAQAHLEPAFTSITEVLASSLAQVEDALHSLHLYTQRTELDPEGLASLDERLSLWLQLARRYKRLPEELPALLASWQEQLSALDSATDLDALQQAAQHTQAAYQQAAQTLSQQRRKAAPRLAQAITHAIQGLGMEGGVFAVQIQDLTSPGADGLDDVQFLVAGHPGASPRPIGKVASGGELSRLSLAIAVTTSAKGQAPTLIFDEVDAGIGGAVAQTVGRLMHDIGHTHQVLAVTHLPQVAACADQHYVVSKRRSKTGSTSQVTPATAAQREQEIARMLGGDSLSAASLAHAREMLDGQAPSS